MDSKRILIDMLLKRLTDVERDSFERVFKILNKGNVVEPMFSEMDCLGGLKENNWSVNKTISFLKELKEKSNLEDFVLPKKAKLFDLNDRIAPTSISEDHACQTDEEQKEECKRCEVLEEENTFYRSTFEKLQEKHEIWETKYKNQTKVAKGAIQIFCDPIGALIKKGIDLEMGVVPAIWRLDLGESDPVIKSYYDNMGPPERINSTSVRQCNFVLEDGSLCDFKHALQNTKLHVLGQHLKNSSYGYLCSACPELNWFQKHSVLSHMDKVHDKPLPFSCHDCFKTFVSESSLKKHETGCNPWPTNEALPDYIYDEGDRDGSMRTVILRKTVEKDRKAIRELWICEWEHSDGFTLSPHLYSCGHTKLRDLKQAVTHNLYLAESAFTNGKDIGGCGSLRQMLKDDFILQVNDVQSTGIFCTTKWVAEQLKWIVRRYLNCIFVLSPPEAQERISEKDFESHLKIKLEPFLKKMDIHTKNYEDQQK